MTRTNQNRRDFLKSTAVAGAAASVPYVFSSDARADDTKSEAKNDRPIMASIGTGSRWGAVGPNAMKFADCVAVCDVDARHAERAQARVEKDQKHKPEVFEDYRKVLDRKDVEIVTIVTTDHWHTKIAIEAMQAGKDVYCEKPLTLTIEEGKQICEVQKKTGQVFQVGTQQRSEMGLRFLQAIAMIREGRIGDVEKVTCNIGGAPRCDEIPVAEVPTGLNWDMWLGQAPMVDYRHNGKKNTRCHYEFRWWYEYSGGKLTDWGAHHVDIAQWAIEQNGPDQGVRSLEPVLVEHPVDLKDGMPVQDDRYNTSHKFHIKCMFDGGVEMNIVSNSPDGNGILFEGTKGRFHVARGRTKGAPFEALKEKPLPENAIADVYGGKMPAKNNAHMANFIDCIKTRKQPVSDVHSHHRALTTCHLSNIAIRLGRKLKWDPVAQRIVGDDEANAWQTREQRKGYEIKV